jgi:hypothetical protein
MGVIEHCLGSALVLREVACDPDEVMDQAAVVAALDCLQYRSVDAWIDGGWGIDALVGEQTREHADLDLVVAQDALVAAQSALATLGYRHDTTIQPGLPARMVLLDPERRQIDLHPVVFDAHGNGWQPLGNSAWGGYPAEGLTATQRRHDLRLLGQRFGVPLPPGY